MQVEHGSEPIVGWRVWNLSDAADGPLLWPVAPGAPAWPPRTPTVATCSVSRLVTGRLARHEAPDAGCRCGIYASDSPTIVERGRPAWPPPTVIGRVAVWGRTIAHEHGWRARFAYPDRLRLACVACAWIEPGPGEPTVVHAFRRRLYGLCDMHAGGLQLQDGRRTKLVDLDPREVRDRLLAAYAVDLLPVEPIEHLFGRPAAPDVPPYVPTVRVVPLDRDR